MDWEIEEFGGVFSFLIMIGRSENSNRFPFSYPIVRVPRETEFCKPSKYSKYSFFGGLISPDGEIRC